MNEEQKAYLESIGLLKTESPHPNPFNLSDDEPAHPTDSPAKGDRLVEIGNLKQALKQKVYGQDSAIEAICDQMIKQAWQPRVQGPAGVFLFVGPSGTGKSHLANQLKSSLVGDWTIRAIDMAAMTNENQSAELDGNEPSYSNARPGQLTSFVRAHPRTVVVFDNVDRSHPVIINRLVGMLDTGFMKDRFGFYAENNLDKTLLGPPEVDFRECIVIFTTRAGENAYEDAAFKRQVKQNPHQASTMLLHELAELKATVGGTATETRQFSASLLNHWSAGGLILFGPLKMADLTRIAAETIEKVKHDLGRLFHGEVRIDDLPAWSRLLVLVLTPNVDARRLQRDGVKLLFDPATDFLMQQKDQPKSIWLKMTGALSAFVDEAAIASRFEGQDVLAECARRNLNLAYKTRAYAEGDTVFVEFDAPRLQRVPHAQDIRGAGAVRVEVPEISFANIAGHHVAKKRLQEVVRLLKAPGRLAELDVGIPKGMLLYGPPGTGKTLLAKALAHEADLPFISTTGSEILNLEFLKTVFKRARKYAPSLLFIDEVEVIGRRDQGGYDVIINQLLIEIDGFDSSLSAPIFIVVATNLPNKIDPAIIRSGRIDLHLEIPTLDRDARSYFIDRYLELPNDGSFNRNVLLAHTAGMSGADLEKIRREVALDMVRRGNATVSQTDLLEYINTMKYGARSSQPRRQQMQEHVAYHEAGHAVVAVVVNPEIDIEQITIVPRQEMGGFVSFDREQVDQRRKTRQEVIDDICIALAGRLAQEKRFPGEGADIGASSDLQKASTMAYLAVTEWGLDPEFCPLSLKGLPENPVIQAIATAEALPRVRHMLAEAQSKSRAIIDEYWVKIESVAIWLQAEGTMEGKMLVDLMSGPKTPT